MKREIQISRKTIITSLLLFLSIALICAGILLPRQDMAFLSKFIEQFKGTISAPAQPDHQSSPDALAASVALNAFYTLDYTESVTQWQGRVCALATADGCKVIQTLFAPAVRKVIEANQVKTGCTVKAIRLVEDKDDTHTWLLEVTLDRPWSGEKPTTQVYAEVAQTNGTWLLNRILFDQETVRFITPVSTPTP